MTTYLAQAAESNMSVIILITGFAVVFAVLFLLIGIIKIYSSIVSGAQNAAQRKKEKNNQKKLENAPVVEVQPEPEVVLTPALDDTLDLQTVAVITAAVEAYYAGSKKVRVAGIRKSTSARSEWATAGLMESIPQMRTEGLL